ncbi:MAG: ribosome biogenesis GTPase YlqF [Solirubrobacterales bacterium]
MSVNWYPGHMVKARREIVENIKLVDVVAEILDARAPESTRNPDLEALCGKKPVLLVLNKHDLADPDLVKHWIKKYRKQGREAVAINAVAGVGLPEVFKAITRLFEPASKAMIAKNWRPRPPRVMVVGIPNVGKSTFMNSILKKKSARTGPTPGVTRGKQWVRLQGKIDLLDTPGLMWPKVENPEQGLRLAVLNLIGEKAYDEMDAANYAIQALCRQQPGALKEKFGISVDGEPDLLALMTAIAMKRRFIDGESPDLDRAGRYVLAGFRKGEYGRICLDRPEEFREEILPEPEPETAQMASELETPPKNQPADE